jgi:outer membrane protein OmpA-like peptidoglycan-associated protein
LQHAIGAAVGATRRASRNESFVVRAFVLLPFLAGAFLFLTDAGFAQDSPADVKKKEIELERQRLDLEKKTLELQRREAELNKMRQELQAQQSAQSLSMNLSGDVLFDYDKAELKPAAGEALKKVAVVLSQFPESKVTVEGYTDAKGTASVNMQLSRDRATAVKDWLVKNGGVTAAPISAALLAETSTSGACDAPVPFHGI